jgi:hypothetical protein
MSFTRPEVGTGTSRPAVPREEDLVHPFHVDRPSSEDRRELGGDPDLPLLDLIIFFSPSPFSTHEHAVASSSEGTALSVGDDRRVVVSQPKGPMSGVASQWNGERACAVERDDVDQLIGQWHRQGSTVRTLSGRMPLLCVASKMLAIDPPSKTPKRPNPK